MKTAKLPRPRGAFGFTALAFTPQCKRMLTMDVTNCPHCGGHHASLDVHVHGNRMIVYCPAFGGRPITATFKLFLHP